MNELTEEKIVTGPVNRHNLSVGRYGGTPLYLSVDEKDPSFKRGHCSSRQTYLFEEEAIKMAHLLSLYLSDETAAHVPFIEEFGAHRLSAYKLIISPIKMKGKILPNLMSRQLHPLIPGRTDGPDKKP